MKERCPGHIGHLSCFEYSHEIASPLTLLAKTTPCHCESFSGRTKQSYLSRSETGIEETEKKSRLSSLAYSPG